MRLKTIWSNKHIPLRSALCALWLSQYSCMPAKVGRWYRTSWRNCRPLRWDALGNCLASHTETTSPSHRALWWHDGMGMNQDQQGLPRQFYKVEERADKRSVGRITSLSGQGWSFATPKENVKTKSHGGKGLIGPRRPSGHHDYRIAG